MTILAMIAMIVVPVYAIGEFEEGNPYAISTENSKHREFLDHFYDTNRVVLKTTMQSYENRIDFMRQHGAHDIAKRVEIEKRERYVQLLDEHNQYTQQILKKFGY
jgi:hypothetical protein